MAPAVDTAVVQVSSAPSRALYEAVTGAVDFAAAGDALISHAAAEQPDGSVLIVDVWASADAMDAFEREQLLPAFGRVPGADVAMTNRPTRHAAFHVVAR